MSFGKQPPKTNLDSCVARKADLLHAYSRSTTHLVPVYVSASQCEGVTQVNVALPPLIACDGMCSTGMYSLHGAGGASRIETKCMGVAVLAQPRRPLRYKLLPWELPSSG